ncbi:MAG: hypothetical protein K1000chlam2_00859 [Chlamydiae bacterium]|nr:hypothetical protein [Chlamydiota bacterium]
MGIIIPTVSQGQDADFITNKLNAVYNDPKIQNSWNQVMNCKKPRLTSKEKGILLLGVSIGIIASLYAPSNVTRITGVAVSILGAVYGCKYFVKNNPDAQKLRSLIAGHHDLVKKNWSQTENDLKINYPKKWKNYELLQESISEASAAVEELRRPFGIC